MPLNNANWTCEPDSYRIIVYSMLFVSDNFREPLFLNFLKSYLTNRLTVGKAFRHMHPTGRQPSLSIDKHGESSSMFVRF